MTSVISAWAQRKAKIAEAKQYLMTKHEKPTKDDDKQKIANEEKLAEHMAKYETDFEKDMLAETKTDFEKYDAETKYDTGYETKVEAGATASSDYVRD